MQRENRTPYLVFTPFIEQWTPPEYTSERHKSERARERDLKTLNPGRRVVIANFGTAQTKAGRQQRLQISLSHWCVLFWPWFCVTGLPRLPFQVKGLAMGRFSIPLRGCCPGTLVSTHKSKTHTVGGVQTPNYTRVWVRVIGKTPSLTETGAREDKFQSKYLEWDLIDFHRQYTFFSSF